MGWNHRILAHEHSNEIELEIHEVYYDKDGNPNSCTKNSISVHADTLEGIKWVLERMTECADKPILYYGDKFPQEYKEK
jgi:hypothetical protein